MTNLHFKQLLKTLQHSANKYVINHVCLLPLPFAREKLSSVMVLKLSAAVGSVSESKSVDVSAIW